MVHFISELSKQVELGQQATDPDYLLFQRSVNANVRSGARTRHEILLRKMFQAAPHLAELFDPTIVAEAGIAGEIERLGKSIADLVTKANSTYAATHGEDLFKPTNKTVPGLNRIGASISGYDGYKALVSDLYFIFRESVGSRLGTIPASFVDVNDLRTDVQHDVDHGKPKKIVARRKKVGSVFGKYSGSVTPSTTAPERFGIFQSNLLAAIERDLLALLKSL